MAFTSMRSHNLCILLDLSSFYFSIALQCCIILAQPQSASFSAVRLKSNANHLPIKEPIRATQMLTANYSLIKNLHRDDKVRYKCVQTVAFVVPAANRLIRLFINFLFTHTNRKNEKMSFDLCL